MCTDEHQRVVNDDVLREWERCKAMFEAINQASSEPLDCCLHGWMNKAGFFPVRFQIDSEDCECRARQFQHLIDQQGDDLLVTIDQQKNIYLDSIERHRRSFQNL